jgi:solute carrier family 35 (UDP-sugar transporter), member A1/2/3
MSTLQALILLSLLTQNSSYTLMRKYLQKTSSISSKEVLLVGELIKIVVSVAVILTSDEPSSSKGAGVNKLLSIIATSSKMFVLAGIYLVMNILSFVSLQYIGAGEFSVCAQLKILTTACFSVIILGTRLSETKWRALALLVVGCIMVALPGLEGQQKATTTDQFEYFSPFILFGYGAVILEVALSGFASIYFEKIVKSTTEVVTIWERNFQLSIYSILIYGTMILYDSHKEDGSVAWAGWNWTAVVVAVLGALGGLLVAASLKYADSILKTLATAGAIIISTFLGHFLLDGPFDHDVVLGSVVTVIAIINYTKDSTPPTPESSAKV